VLFGRVQRQRLRKHDDDLDDHILDGHHHDGLHQHLNDHDVTRLRRGRRNPHGHLWRWDDL